MAMTHANPFADGWVDSTLLPLAGRAAAGEDHSVLADELFRTIWPWARSTADRVAARLPGGADRAEARSTVLLAVWQCTRNIDWDRARTWPAALKRRMAGARIDAARASDVMSRRLRAARAALAAARLAAEQAAGRQLTSSEVADLAASLWPNARPAWVAGVLGDTPAPSWGADEVGPDERIERAETCDAVRAWLARDVPQILADRVVQWCGQDRSGDALPARLRRQLDPYVGRLRDLVEIS